MKFFKLTREKPGTGLMTIKPDDEIQVINLSSNIALSIELSNTDGEHEELTLTDETDFKNNTSYLRRPYSRMEIVIADPQLISYNEEIHVKMKWL